ncbi:MAG TPA: hypothetical protein VHL31_00880 [Geminicoccus sp.]|uniref:hypothetical protein n=1 Tax=Geminicoccus sp. TaxID=2024832 RepID=UPI002E305A82|nr:hypothetical protein [Geminicoccus sp.]HEX2524843.1 hypothetical protein [Geminicoccus sp.]
MAKLSIAQASAAGPLTGAELIPALQASAPRSLTTARLAGEVPVMATGAAIGRTAQERAGDWRHAFDFIPRAEWPAILAGSSTYDASADLEAALAASRNLLLPAGTIRVTRAIDGRATNRRIVGMPGARIESTNNSQPVLLVGGFYNEIRGFAVSHATMPSTSEANATGIKLYGLRFSTLANLRVEKSYDAFLLAQEPYVDGNRNFIFSNTFQDIDVRSWRGAAFDLRGYLAGNTGCVFNNIYMSNFNFSGGGSKHRAAFYLQLDDWSECQWTQVNCEHGEISNTPINIGSSVRTMGFSALHYEGVDFKTGALGCLRNNGSAQVGIRGWSIYKCRMLAADIGSIELLRLSTLSRVTIDGLYQSNGDEPGLRDLPISIALYAGSTSTSGAKIEGANIKADDLQVVITGQPGGIEPILYKWETLRDRAIASPGNASFALSATTPAGLVIYDVPLTTNRTLTLSTCTPRHGHVLEVIRTATATGAFSIDVGGMKQLTAAGSSARLVYRSGAWVLLG